MYKLQRRALVIEDILKWADAYREKAGKWPIRNSGSIPGGISEIWVSMDAALRGDFVSFLTAVRWLSYRPRPAAPDTSAIYPRLQSMQSSDAPTNTINGRETGPAEIPAASPNPAATRGERMILRYGPASAACHCGWQGCLPSAATFVVGRACLG